MKRLAVLFFAAFLFWSVVPAGANTIPSIAIACDAVSFAWTGFPTHPVVLTVTVTQGDGVTVASFNTEGATSGEGTVPVQLGNGTASATVSWTLEKEHHAGPVTADLTCETTTTTAPPTTAPPRTPATYRMIPPATAGPELPNTGADTWLLVLGGWMLVGMGAAVLWGARVRRDEQ